MLVNQFGFKTLFDLNVHRAINDGTKIRCPANKTTAVQTTNRFF